MSEQFLDLPIGEQFLDPAVSKQVFGSGPPPVGTATKPAPVERIIALIAGESGDGKSFFLAQLKHALIYDVDRGGGLRYAAARIARNGSERCADVHSYPDLLDDLKRRKARGLLANIQTVSVDPVTVLHQEATDRHNPGMIKDFGTASDKATKEWRRIMTFCAAEDFNVLVTAHLKGKWQDEKQVGLQADMGKNAGADFDIVLQLRRGAGYPSNAWKQKWRRDIDDVRGPVPDVFPFTMETFCRIDGTDALDRAREPVQLATEADVATLAELLDLVKLPEGTTDKWLKKAKVETFAEMHQADIAKCIKHIRALVAGLPASEILPGNLAFTPNKKGK